MPSLFDRLSQELQQFGKRAQAALDEGKLQIELIRYRRQQSAAARDLGLLVHRTERGGEVDPSRREALLVRLDQLEADIARLEREIASARHERISVSSEPAPASATAAEAEVSER